MSDTYNQIIENDVQLSTRILAVQAHAFNSKKVLRFPVKFNEAGEAIEWEEKALKDVFPDIFGDDLTVANLTEQELRAIRIGIDATCQVNNFAFRYGHYSLIEISLLLIDKVNNIVVTSRGRNMEGAKLAKTQLTQSMQEQFHRQYIENKEPEIGKKKGFWQKLSGGK